MRNLGKYRIVAELGHGGMAEVYLSMVAGPLGSGFTKLAVIKRLRPNLVEDPEFIAMLVDEARISARLNHPNAVQTLEVGVENGEYFLAMEFLDGQPLHRIQRRAKRTGSAFPSELEYVIVADTLAGLQHAHELADYDGTPLGIVHRDVTPQNIFVTYDGQVKVVDFGIAKAAGRASETKQGIVKGKVRYMSPEQALGHAIDSRSDIFAAGVLLWEAATKQHFWRDLDDLAIVQALISGDYAASPRARVPEVHAAIDAMCRKALARDADDRYASAADFRADLETYLAESVVAARRKLGPLVAELFAKERGVLREVIERSSRENAEPMSLVTLAASRSSTIMASLSSDASGTQMMPVERVPSLPPVTLGASSQPAALGDDMRSTGPDAAARLRGAAFAGALVMLASVALTFAAVQVVGVTQATGAPASSREMAQLVVGRTPLASRTTRLRKNVARESAATPVPLSWAAQAAPARTPQAAVEAAPSPPVVAAPTAPTASARATPANGSNLHDGSRRRPTIDVSDPWSAAK